MKLCERIKADAELMAVLEKRPELCSELLDGCRRMDDIERIAYNSLNKRLMFQIRLLTVHAVLANGIWFLTE